MSNINIEIKYFVPMDIYVCMAQWKIRWYNSTNRKT